MDYFNNLLDTFLSLDRVWILVAYGGSESLGMQQNILICVPKMNTSYRFEKDEGE